MYHSDWIGIGVEYEDNEAVTLDQRRWTADCQRHVEIDENGEEAGNIGEATDDKQDAIAVSAAAYKAYGQLLENLKALYNSIEKNRPSGVKGKYFKSLYICTTMGSSIQLDLNVFE